MSSRTADVLGAAVLILAGIGLAFGGMGYGLFAEGGRVGPGLMPFAAGTLLVIFGATVGLETVRRRTHAQGDSDEPQPGRGEPQPARGEPQPAGRRPGYSVAMAFGFLLGALLLTDVVGFLPAFGVMVVALIVVVERQEPVRAVAISAAAVALSWALFVLFLGVPLPDGIF